MSHDCSRYSERVLLYPTLDEPTLRAEAEDCDDCLAALDRWIAVVDDKDESPIDIGPDPSAVIAGHFIRFTDLPRPDLRIEVGLGALFAPSDEGAPSTVPADGSAAERVARTRSPVRVTATPPSSGHVFAWVDHPDGSRMVLPADGKTRAAILGGLAEVKMDVEDTFWAPGTLRCIYAPDLRPLLDELEEESPGGLWTPDSERRAIEAARVLMDDPHGDSGCLVSVAEPWRLVD